MSLKVNLVAAAAVATITGVGAIGASHVNAQSADNSTRAQEFAERFGLSEDEVQAYFDEKRAERQGNREERRQEHLQSLVDDGVITEEQKSLLEEKFAELKDAREGVNFRELSDEEKEALKEEKEQRKAEFEQWAEDNGINLDDIKPDHENKRGPFGPRR